MFDKHIEVKQLIYKGIPTFYTISNMGEIVNKRTGEIKKSYMNKDGYLTVSLYVGGRRFSAMLHRLVALTFVPNPDPEHKTQVNHIDGNKANPSYWNLEWVTPQENTQHAIIYGLRGKLTHGRVIEICKLMEEGDKSLHEIAEMFGVCHGTIQSIRFKKNWADIACDYDTMNCKVRWSSAPEETVRKICELIVENKLMLDEISEKVGVSHHVVCDIYHRRTFEDIIKDYDFSHYDKYQRYDKDFLQSIQDLMAEGLTNVEIRDRLGLEKGCKTNTLLYRQRRKFEKKR